MYLILVQPRTHMGISCESMRSMRSNLYGGLLQLRGVSIFVSHVAKQDMIASFLTQQSKMLCFARGKCSQRLPVL